MESTKTPSLFLLPSNHSTTPAHETPRQTTLDKHSERLAGESASHTFQATAILGEDEERRLPGQQRRASIPAGQRTKRGGMFERVIGRGLSPSEGRPLGAKPPSGLSPPSLGLAQSSPPEASSAACPRGAGSQPGPAPLPTSKHSLPFTLLAAPRDARPDPSP